LVVVAELPVALKKVKFWKVEEPVRSRLGKVAIPVNVRAPPFELVKKRFVEEPVVVKKLVVVAEEPVAAVKVKF
jgi:hypothetical protein